MRAAAALVLLLFATLGAFRTVEAGTSPCHGAEAFRSKLGMELLRWGRDELRPLPCDGLSRSEIDGGERTEILRGELVEWVRSLSGGWEHGVDIPAAPPGQGALVLEMRVDGSLLYESSELVLALRDGRRLRLHGLLAVDRTGRTLPSHLEVESGSSVSFVRYVVDDSLAQYPIVVDPYLWNEPIWSVAGQASGQALGTNMATGDLNGDGLSDLAIGVPGEDVSLSGEGRMQVFLATGAGFGTTPDLVVDGDQAYGFLGWGLALGGDCDGDGFGDLAVGQPGRDVGVLPEAGGVHLLLGGVAPDALSDALIEGTVAMAMAGQSLEWLGDTDGDGLADLAVGVPGWSDGELGEGGVAIYLGSSATYLQLGVWWESNQVDAMAGFSLSAGDVSGDGLIDLAIGAPGWAQAGAVLLLRGQLSGLESSPSWMAFSSAGDEQFGWSVDLGDATGDGVGDVLVGAPGAASLGPNTGAAYLFPGQSPAPIQTAAWSLEGSEEGAWFGFSVAVAGDLDGDALDDVVVGAPFFDSVTTNSGRVLVAQGQGPTLTGTVGVEWDSGQHGYAGLALLGPGDLAGSSRGDLLVASNQAPSGLPPATTGVVWLLSGLASNVDEDQDGFCGLACDPLVGAGDCDDNDVLIYPGATERCNGVDDDCDGLIAVDEQDQDGDGFRPCEGDCSDLDASTNPNAPELCDSIDHDCVDGPENGVTLLAYWPDQDQDGFGDENAPSQQTCQGAPLGTVDNNLDCDDTDETINPDQVEESCTGIDEDCQIQTPDRPDEDGDGVTLCESCIAGEALCGDCNDHDRSIGPQMDETCGDEIDQDCRDGDLPCEFLCGDEGAPCNSGCSCTAKGKSRPRMSLWLLLLGLALGRRR